MQKWLKKLIFPVIGLASLIWFLVRVIPKPSRAAYPCMRATAPIASSFVIYIVGLVSSLFIFKKARKYLYESRYALFSLTMLVGLILGLAALIQTDKKAYAVKYATLEEPNQPMGDGKGIYPGRVVWIHDPDATNENCSNRSNDYWCDDKNTNQAVVNRMVADALVKLTNERNAARAWDAIFRHYNQNHGKGDVGYKKGEKIVIKINLNAGCSGASYTRWNLKNIDTSPHIVYAILDQLVNSAGVAQTDIGFGDPGRTVDDLFWNKCRSKFPGVQYWGEGNGRTEIKRSKDYVMFTSDGSMKDWLPQCYLDAEYMINIPVLKKHHRAGVSLTSKNHFGSFVPFRGGANHWHFSLPASEGGGDVNHGDYGQYRCFVDIMGHKDLGGKTMLYLVDGLWSSTNWGHPPIKWEMAPFNNDWPSSIFMSQDPVAIESVGFDFLYTEFDRDHPTEGKYDPSDNKGPFPQYAGVDDFLHQAADAGKWPAGIKYDPEKDGTLLPKSMGAHEHWNNAKEKLYSRNMGKDTGIELVSPYHTTAVEEPANHPEAVKDFVLLQNHPNPFNPATTIEYALGARSRVNLTIYNMHGQQVQTLVNEEQETGHYTWQWDGHLENGLPAPSGVYFYQLITHNGTDAFRETRKMILSK